jgi:hypothetical protein
VKRRDLSVRWIDEMIALFGRERAMQADQSPFAGRFMLWIDGVGGYLVCEGPTVAVGRPGADSAADIPVMADISRRHAVLHREGEHYLLEPLRTCRVAGHGTERIVRLADTATIELGDDPKHAVRLRFRVPNACTRTARLDLESHHRLQPHADGVLLPADTVLIGPAADDHVRAPGWPRSVLLHRRGDGTLIFRAEGTYDVDGVRSRGSTRISRSARIRSSEFSLRLEPLA